MNRGLASSRFNLMGMALIYPAVIFYAATRVKLPRKLYTEILADTGSDGEYVRQMLSSRKPGLWEQIRPQLGKLGYDFKEMAG